MTRKNLLLVVISLCIGVVLVQKRKVKHELELDLENVTPIQIWSEMRTFERIASLNPTIISYQLEPTKMSGHTNDLEFGVRYKEHLVYIPIVTHEATATYKLSTDTLTIESVHVTELVGTTLTTTEILKFTETQTGTRITTTVEFECHLLAYFYCQLEFNGQRERIHGNIEKLARSIPAFAQGQRSP